MQFKREFLNGFIIFVGIGLYFLLLELVGLSDEFYLRILNIFIVIYGVNRTIKGNYEAGVRGYFTNLIAAVMTSMIGAVLSIIGLMIYIEIRGGEAYLQQLADTFLFGGGQLTMPTYFGGLLLESTAASLSVSFVMMQYWKSKIEVINKIE